MEKMNGLKIMIKNQTFTLYNEPLQQYGQDYFDLYPCQPHGVVMISSLDKYSLQQIKNALNRWEKYSSLLGTAHFAPIRNSGKIQFHGQNYYYLLFPDLNMSACVANNCKWLSSDQIFELAVVFFKMIQQIHKKQLYFGSFRKTRIFMKPDGQYIFLPAFLTYQQTSCQQYKQKITVIQSIIDEDWKYQCPEIYTQPKKKLTYKSDLFVAACILYEIITGSYPFHSKNQLVSKNKVCPPSITDQFCNILFNTILKLEPQDRPQPEQLLQRLQIQKSKILFSTNLYHNLNLEQGESSTLSIFDNIQEFFVKCVKETEGWFLHYCENTPEMPDHKYLEQIIKKMAMKKEKISKIIPMIQKYSTMKIKTMGKSSGNDEIYTYSVIKLGLFIMQILRKTGGWPDLLGQTQIQKIKKYGRKVVQKKPACQFLCTIFKLIVFKLTLQQKFPILKGNFHLSVQKFIQSIDVTLLQVFSEYCLKIVSYLGRLTGEKDKQNLSLLENAVLSILCEELYDGFSVLVFWAKSWQKDHQKEGEQVKQLFNKIFDNIKSILVKIEKLCIQSQEISHNKLYSIETDPYTYQEKIQLIYQPVFTSYQYFYYDNNQYKGLSLPKNYCLEYGLQDEQQLPGLQNRKFFSHRKQSILKPKVFQTKSNTNGHKNVISNDKQASMKSEGSKMGGSEVKLVKNTSKTQRIIGEDKMMEEFMNFSTSQNQQSKTSCTTKNESSQNCMSESMVSQKTVQQQFQQTFSMHNTDEIFSYEWLKKTQKIMIQKKLFVKPEIEAKIHILYEEIARGLKLQQLIQTLEKNKRNIIDPNEVLFQKVIGSGSAGDVYIGKYQEKIVAIKKVKTSTNPNALKQFQREVLTYIKIKSHPNLVSMVGLTKFNGDYFLLTEFCDAGSLFDLLHKKVNQISLSWKDRLELALGIALGMNVLHQMNPPVIHRDMKSLNVFISSKENGKGWVAKVADFGLSRTPDAGMMTSALGTLHWMAPELLCNKQYSLKVDVYSFGIVLWEICSRRTPYHNQTTPMAIVKHVVMQKGRPLKQLIHEGCPESLINLMQKCWAEDPQQRPYFPEIIESLKKVAL